MKNGRAETKYVPGGSSEGQGTLFDRPTGKVFLEQFLEQLATEKSKYPSHIPHVLSADVEDDISHLTRFHSGG